MPRIPTQRPCLFLPLAIGQFGITLRVDELRARTDEYRALFRVNRQIRREACSIFFSVNRFCFRNTEALRTHVYRYPGAFSISQATSIETSMDFEVKNAHYSSMFNPNFRDSITALRCLQDATRLKNLYISMSIPICEHQSWVESVLSEALRTTVGLGPTITVELNYCPFCAANGCTPRGDLQRPGLVDLAVSKREHGVADLSEAGREGDKLFRSCR